MFYDGQSVRAEILDEGSSGVVDRTWGDCVWRDPPAPIRKTDKLALPRRYAMSSVTVVA
jgi:hypothetical protein